MKIYPQKLHQINPKYRNNFFMNRSPIIQKEQNPLTNKYKTITRSSNPKITKFLSCSQYNSKTLKTCYFSQSETGGKREMS